MSCYLIGDYKLEFNAGLNMLYVVDTESQQVASYNLATTAYKLEADDVEYKISAVSVPTGQYFQEFKVASDDTFGIDARAGIGISDLRTTSTRSQFEYHLADCPVILKYANSALGVYSPCTGVCPQPSSTCCTITAID